MTITLRHKKIKASKFDKVTEQLNLESAETHFPTQNIDKSSTLLYIYHMTIKKPHYEFSADKNQQLIKERDISFEDVIVALDNDKLITTLDHHNRAKYPNQKIYILDINEYAYLVPFVRKDKNTIFLKTIIPSRKLTKKFLKRGE